MKIQTQLAQCFTEQEMLAAAAPAEGIEIRGMAGEHATLIKVQTRKGYGLAMHSHPQEQMVCVLSGRVRFTYENQAPHEVGPGEFVRIPGNVAHLGETLEDAVTIEIFCPARNDILAGN